MTEKSIEQRREDLNHKTFKMMLRVAVIFGVPAAIGFFVGRWVDMTYDMRPKGTLMVLGVTFLFSWILVIRMYLQLDKAHKELRKEEEKETDTQNTESN